MGPDYWFVAMGIAAAAAGAAILAGAVRRRNATTIFKGSLWLVLAAGFLLQGFAPHVPIEGGSFKLPELAESSSVDPIGLVSHERQMHVLSLLLTVIGALGLAYYYRRQVFPTGDSRNA
jgi:hypothetical protein